MMMNHGMFALYLPILASGLTPTMGSNHGQGQISWISGFKVLASTICGFGRESNQSQNTEIGSS